MESTNMHDLLVRDAHPDDLETIVEFNCRIATETEGLHLDRATVQAGVRAMFDDVRRGRYFVACLDNRPIGQLMHTREWSDWRNGDIWWLQSIYVHPDHRGRGVLRRLYRHTIEEARKQPEVVGLRLYVEQNNAQARTVYERLGMEESGYLVLESMFS